MPQPVHLSFMRIYSRPYDPDQAYRREPLAIDVSEGKTDPIYAAHSYHTKVPYRAIVRAILHYTEPGDLVLDGFSGSGMTGVAAQICGQLDAEFELTLRAERKNADEEAPRFGARRVVLNDLSPVATFISANYNIPFDIGLFERKANRILLELRDELGWMYETLHSDGKTKGRINYTVWSEVFGCPNCSNEVTFLEEALEENGRVLDIFPCPHCGIELTKHKLDRLYEIVLDKIFNQTVRRIKRKPVIINYSVGSINFS